MPSPFQRCSRAIPIHLGSAGMHLPCSTGPRTGIVLWPAGTTVCREEAPATAVPPSHFSRLVLRNRSERRCHC